MINRNRALTSGAAALIAAGAMSLATVAPAMAAPGDAATGLAPDTATTSPSTPVSIDVLANDVAAAGVELEASSLALVGEDGELTSSVDSELGAWTVADGQLAFAPTAGATGEAQVDYAVTALDGSTLTGTVTVTIEEPAATEPAPEEPAPEEPAPIEPAPEEPAVSIEAEDDRVAQEFDAKTTDVTVDVLANDEVDGEAELDASTLALVGEDGAPVEELETEEGTWAVVDGQVVFTPAEGFAGKAVAEYTVETASGETATAEVRVDATQAAPEPEIALEDDTLELPRHEEGTVDVLANDTVEGATIDAESLQLIGEDGQPADEVTTRAGTFSVVDGEIEFAPHPSLRGETEVSYVVDAGGQTAGATLTVDVDQHQAHVLR